MKLNEESKKYLEKRLNLKKYYNSKQIDEFYDSLDKYVIKRKIYLNDLTDCLDEGLDYLNLLGFNFAESIEIFKNYPPIIHVNKRDFLTKYLLLACLKEKDGTLIRKEIVLYNPKYLIIGLKTLYARYKFFLEQQRSKYLTKYYLLKMTNQEFKNTFDLGMDEVIETYPFDETVIKEFLDWPENKEIKENIEKYQKENQNA